MQYGQTISNAYNPPQSEHNNMFSGDHKDNILKTKIERDREDGNDSWRTLFDFELYSEL